MAWALVLAGALLERVSLLLLATTIVLASLLCNWVQALALLVGAPEVAQHVATVWWVLLAYFVECVSAIPVFWTGEALPTRKERAVLIANHGPGLDAVSGLVVAERAGIGCGRVITFLKRSLLAVPCIGFTHYLQGSIFLNRDWDLDQRILNRKLKAVSRLRHHVWVGLYPEETRFSQLKLRQAQQRAREEGLPQPKNILLPKAQGFVYLLSK